MLSWKDFLKFTSNSHISLSYSFGMKTINTHTLPQFPRKPYPTPDQSLHPFSDRNGTKPIPFWAAHTYMVYIREYPPPPHGGNKWIRSTFHYFNHIKKNFGRNFRKVLFYVSLRTNFTLESVRPKPMHLVLNWNFLTDFFTCDSYVRKRGLTSCTSP